MTVLSSTRTRPLLGEIWRYREFLRSLIERDLKVKYQRSFLGFVWTLLNPLLTVGILVTVFSYIVRIDVEDYWAFLLSGFFVWNFIQQMLLAGTTLMEEHAQLRRNVAFPNEVLVLSAAASRLVEFSIELAVALSLITLLHHQGLPASFALLPLLVTLQLLIAMGLTMLVSTLAVFYQDVKHVLPILALALFYGSPVFYPASLVPEAFRGAYMANPLAALLSCYHVVLYEGEFPAWSLLAGVFAAAALIAVLGYGVFSRKQSLFAEVV